MLGRQQSPWHRVPFGSQVLMDGLLTSQPVPRPWCTSGHEAPNESNSCRQCHFLFSPYKGSCFPAVLDPEDQC